MVLPSGEKATKFTGLLCALCVAALSCKEFMSWLCCAYGWGGDSAGWNLLGVWLLHWGHSSVRKLLALHRRARCALIQGKETHLARRVRSLFRARRQAG